MSGGGDSHPLPPPWVLKTSKDGTRSFYCHPETKQSLSQIEPHSAATEKWGWYHHPTTRQKTYVNMETGMETSVWPPLKRAVEDEGGGGGGGGGGVKRARDSASSARVTLGSLCTRFSTGGRTVSPLACPALKTPHYAFARRSLAQLALQPALGASALADTGYGHYCRFEYAALSGRQVRGCDKDGLLDGELQWHTPQKYLALIRGLLRDVASGKGITPGAISGLPFAPREGGGEEATPQHYFIVDGAHRVAFLLALLGPEAPITISIPSPQELPRWVTASPAVAGLVPEQRLVDHIPTLLDSSAPHNRPLQGEQGLQ